MEQTEILTRTHDRILLVDDDAVFLKIAGNILNAKGFSIGLARNAAEAIEETKNNHYNMVIVDMVLPDIPGLDLLTLINRIQPDIVSVVLTGYSSVESSIQSINIGVFAYLEKPINPDKLMEVIRRGLEKYHLLAENRRLLRELEQRNRDLNILLTVRQAASRGMNNNQIVGAVMEIVSRTLAVDGCYIHVSKKGKERTEGQFGFNDSVVDVIKNTDLTEGIYREVVLKYETVAMNQIKNSGDIINNVLYQNGYRSALGVPVSMSGSHEGIMLVATLTKHIFTPLEVNLFKAIGRETASAMNNLELFEEASNIKALRELDALRTELLANVSHELRTPLAAIKGFASSLLQPDISFDEQTRYGFIQTIDSEADRLSHLIDDLLLMSRIEAGAYKARKEWYEPKEIFSSIRDRLYNITLKHQLNLNIPDELPPILVDGSRVGQVITNLVENAVKYSPEGSEILVTAEKQGDRLVVNVQDHGIGIPEEAWTKVFERFYRHPNDINKKGFGLGLSICRGIVESHSGKIWVKSQPGKGSCFSFSLPLDPEPISPSETN